MKRARLNAYLELSARWNGPDAVRAEHAPRRLTAEGVQLAIEAGRYLAAVNECAPSWRAESDEVGVLDSPFVRRVRAYLGDPGDETRAA